MNVTVKARRDPSVDTKVATLAHGDSGTADAVVSPSPSIDNQSSRSTLKTNDQIWETKLAATPPQVLGDLVTKVRADIAAGKTRSFKSTKRK